MSESSEYLRGLMDGKLQSHDLRLSNIDRDLKELKENIDTLLGWVNQLKGGKTVMWGMFGAAAALGGLIAESISAISHLFHK